MASARPWTWPTGQHPTSRALKSNADHYAYAAERHTSGAALAASAQAGVVNRTQAFQRASSLCFFKCQRVMPLMLWLVDHYAGQPRMLHDDTIGLNEDRMGLGGRTFNVVPDPASSSLLPNFFRPKVRADSAVRADLLPICKERTQMLHDALEAISSYLSRPHQLVEVHNQIEVQPVNRTIRTLRYPVDVADDVNQLAKRIFMLTLQDYSFNALQAEQMFDWSDALFANIMQDKQHQDAYRVNAEMVKLHQILLA